LKGEVPVGFVVTKAGVTRSDADIVAEIVQKVRDTIGPVAAFKTATVVKRLPKTRSGKILRGTVKRIADGTPYTMPATIDGPASSAVVEVPVGTTLTRSGDPGEESFFILDGAATVEVTRRKRGRLGPGAFFGEMSLLDGGPRSATVRAETDMRLLVILRRNFQTLLSEVPELTRSILIVLSRRLRDLERALNA